MIRAGAFAYFSRISFMNSGSRIRLLRFSSAKPNRYSLSLRSGPGILPSKWRVRMGNGMVMPSA